MQFKVAGALRRHHVSVPGARWRAGFVRARGTEQGTIRADLGVAIAVMAPTGQATNCTHAQKWRLEKTATPRSDACSARCISQAGPQCRDRARILGHDESVFD